MALDDFRNLDRNYYDGTTQVLEGEGFVRLGEIEDAAESRKHPSRRVCYRVLADPAGVVAAVYQIPATGIVFVLQMATSLKYVDYETEFTDGEFLSTTNNGLGETNPHVDKHIELQATPVDLLKLHRQRVETYLEENPSVEVRTCSSLGDAIAAQQRQHLLKSHPKKRRPKIRRPRRKRQGAPWRSRLLQGFYDRRLAIANVLTWILIGMVWGFLARNHAYQSYDQGRQLTLEKYEAAFESYKARETQPPNSLPAVSAFAASGLAVFFLIYEGTRLGLARLLARSLKGVVKTEDSEKHPPPPRRLFGLSPSGIGKITLIVAASLLLGHYEAARSADRYEKGQALTLEDYLAEFESHREELVQAPRSDFSYFLTGLLGSGFVIGFYELTGGMVAAVVALATGGSVPFGTHVFLSTIGTLLIFLGGAAVLFFLIGPKVRETWPEGWPEWIQVPAFLITVVGLWSGAQWFLKAVPVPCRECGGKAYCIENKPLRYQCRQCRHVR